MDLDVVLLGELFSIKILILSLTWLLVVFCSPKR